jgi:DNA-binding beta-propeller fold protein YncE
MKRLVPPAKRWLVAAGLTALLLAATARSARPDALIVTTQAVNGGANALLSVDTVSHAIGPVLALGGSFPDSLIFDSAGNILYTTNGGSPANEIRSFNPTTKVDSLVLGGLAGPRDLALEPGLKAVLVANIGAGFPNNILRVTLPAGPASTLPANPGGFYNGITYDNSGRLFAVINAQFLAELNPATGALLNFRNVGSGADGLTFDPVTGDLFVSNNGGFISEVDEGLTTQKNFGNGLGTLDGIESNGMGSIFVASYAVGIYEFDIGKGTFGNFISVPGIDAIAPVVGLGSAGEPVPEPSSLALVGLGTVGLVGWGWLRRRRGQTGVADA